MVIIDAHTHIFPPDLIADREGCCQADRWFGHLYTDPRARLAAAEELISSMDAAGVDASVAFGFAFTDMGRCRQCNDYVLEAARRYPGRLVPFVVANPRADEAALAELGRCLEAGAKGIGELMPDGQEFDLTDACLEPLMSLSQRFRVPVMTHVNESIGHVYPGKGSQGPEQAYQLATQYTENTLILAHWGGGLPFYELMPEVRAALRKVYYDTAASLYLYDDAIFRHVMAWAPTKVLWGSDYPLIGQSRFLGRVKQAGLEPSALARLLGGNAAAVLGLQP